MNLTADEIDALQELLSMEQLQIPSDIVLIFEVGSFDVLLSAIAREAGV